MAHRIRCFVCNVASDRRIMLRLQGDENIRKREIALRFRENLQRPPAPYAEDSRVCISCQALITNETQFENNPAYTRLNIMRTGTNGTCIICRRNGQLQRLSMKCRTDIFINRGIYVPENIRSCPEHLDDEG